MIIGSSRPHGGAKVFGIIGQCDWPTLPCVGRIELWEGFVRRHNSALCQEPPQPVCC